MNLGTLLLHWIASHRVLELDLPHLPMRSSRVVRYEDLAQRTRSCMVDALLPFPSLEMLIPRRVAVRANLRQDGCVAVA